MKVPDKIYCENCSDGMYAHTGMWETGDNIAYIRKDALLEWAKARKSGLSSGESFVAGERKMLKEIIEKIESL